MELHIIIAFFTLIVVVVGFILMRPIKVIQIVVPWIVVVASVLLFGLGWEWERLNASTH